VCQIYVPVQVTTACVPVCLNSVTVPFDDGDAVVPEQFIDAFV
jgi:hypothetical protein